MTVSHSKTSRSPSHSTRVPPIPAAQTEDGTEPVTQEDFSVSPLEIEAYLKGEVEITELIGLDDATAELLRGRAQFFLDGGHHERALIMLEMLEVLDRRDPTPSLLAVEVLLKLGRSDEAEAKITAMLERDPECAEARNALAQMLIQSGQMVPAAAVLEQVLEKDPEGQTVAGARALAIARRASALFEHQG